MARIWHRAHSAAAERKGTASEVLHEQRCGAGALLTHGNAQMAIPVDRITEDENAVAICPSPNTHEICNVIHLELKNPIKAGPTFCLSRHPQRLPSARCSPLQAEGRRASWVDLHISLASKLKAGASTGALSILGRPSPGSRPERSRRGCRPVWTRPLLLERGIGTAAQSTTNLLRDCFEDATVELVSHWGGCGAGLDTGTRLSIYHVPGWGEPVF